jgi:hypothetical protein
LGLENFVKNFPKEKKIKITHVPWLWKYTSEYLLAIDQVTASHHCHFNDSDSYICISDDHISPMNLDENRGLNYCSPCICVHELRCLYPGSGFRTMIRRSTEKQNHMRRGKMMERAMEMQKVSLSLSTHSGDSTTTTTTSTINVSNNNNDNNNTNMN